MSFEWRQEVRQELNTIKAMLINLMKLNPDEDEEDKGGKENNGKPKIKQID